MCKAHCPVGFRGCACYIIIYVGLYCVTLLRLQRGKWTEKTKQKKNRIKERRVRNLGYIRKRMFYLCCNSSFSARGRSGTGTRRLYPNCWAPTQVVLDTIDDDTTKVTNHCFRRCLWVARARVYGCCLPVSGLHIVASPRQ